MKGKKTGGRTAGTPNKISVSLRQAISNMLDEYYNSENFAKDLAELEPRERVSAIEKLTAYAVPKLQATALEVTESGKNEISDLLTRLSEESV